MTEQEKNAWIAEKVHGWVRHKGDWRNDNGTYMDCVAWFAPCNNVAQAIEALEAWRMQDHRRKYSIDSEHKSSMSKQFIALYYYELLDSYDNYFHITNVNNDLAHAITDALIKATGGE